MPVGPVQTRPLESAPTLPAAPQPNIFVRIWRAVNAFVLGPVWKAHCWSEFNGLIRLRPEIQALSEEPASRHFFLTKKIELNSQGKHLFTLENFHRFSYAEALTQVNQLRALVNKPALEYNRLDAKK